MPHLTNDRPANELSITAQKLFEYSALVVRMPAFFTSPATLPQSTILSAIMISASVRRGTWYNSTSR
jgi:hypothetical protein